MKIVIAVLCICVASTPGFAQESPAPVKLSPEQQAIRANAEAFVAAFNQGDAKAVSALWAEEGEMSLDGEPVAVGRVEVAAKYAEYFAENEGASIQIEIDSIRVLGPNLAVERGRSEVVNDDDDTAVDAYRLVYTRVDDAWLIATADVQQEFFEAPYDWKNELEFSDREMEGPGWRLECRNGVRMGTRRQLPEANLFHQRWHTGSANGNASDRLGRAKPDHHIVDVWNRRRSWSWLVVQAR